MFHILVGLLVLFTGCASNGPKYVVDDSVIENVPTHEKLNIEQAKKSIQNAEQAKKNADLQLEKAEEALTKAEKSKAIAKNQLNVANLSSEVADTEYNLAKMNIKLAKLNQENMKKEIFAAQNQQELEKAKIVDQKGIKLDKDFSLRKFETATLEAKKDSTDSQLDAAKLAKEVEELSIKLKKQTEKYLEAKND